MSQVACSAAVTATRKIGNSGDLQMPNIPIRAARQIQLVAMSEKRLAGSVWELGLLPSCPSIGVTQGFDYCFCSGPVV